MGPSAHTGAPEPSQGQVGPSARGFQSLPPPPTGLCAHRWACRGQGAACLPLRSEPGEDGEPASPPSPNVTKGRAAPAGHRCSGLFPLLKSELGVPGGGRQTEKQTNKGTERRE